MDIALDANGDIDLTTREPALVSGLDAIAQHLKIRLRFIKGEWHLDTREGVPYFEEIFEVGVDLRVIESIMRKVVLGTPGITSIVTIELTPDYAARTLDIALEALTREGVLTSADFGPFVVSA